MMTETATMAPADIGIVIIGRNEGSRLIACLESVNASTSTFVYVDSGSTDGSADVARSHGALVVELDPGRPFTAARARNEGAIHLFSRHPHLRVIQFVDGDCTLCGGWLAKASAFIAREPKVAVVCGRRRELDVSASIYNRLCDIEWDTPIGQTTACGGDALMRTSAFLEVGGYNDALIAGEEPELCMRLRAAGWTIWRLDSDMTLHDAALLRFGQWWKRSVRGGHAMAEVVALHWEETDLIWVKELFSAFVWALALPLSLFVATLLWAPAAIGALIYLFQLCRVAVRRRGRQLPWTYSLFMILAKFAEVQGALAYYWRAANRRTTSLIEYKKAPPSRQSAQNRRIETQKVDRNAESRSQFAGGPTPNKI